MFGNDGHPTQLVLPVGLTYLLTLCKTFGTSPIIHASTLSKYKTAALFKPEHYIQTFNNNICIFSSLLGESLAVSIHGVVSTI